MEISLPGEPVSLNQIYRYSCNRGFLHKYMSAAGKSRKEEYSWAFKTNRPKDWSLKEKYRVEVLLFFKDRRAHDVDNYLKILLDAGSGILWDDDKQICQITVSKAIDKENPRIDVIISTI